MSLPLSINLVQCHPLNILEQLKLEEALLRTSDQAWCLINSGSAPSIVMGISGKQETSIRKDLHQQLQVPVIQRFSGGGTVIVDDDTLFLSFIFPRSFHRFVPFPETIFRWSDQFLQQALGLPSFRLKETDFVIANRKCGGNAQYIRKNCWLQHTTFLWDYKQEYMDLLLLPEKQPKYRENRSHEAFLSPLKACFPKREMFFDCVIRALSKQYKVKNYSLERALLQMQEPHRKATKLVACR